MEIKLNGNEFDYLMENSSVNQLVKDGDSILMTLTYHHLISQGAHLILRTQYHPDKGFCLQQDLEAKAAIVWASKSLIREIQKHG